MPSTGRSRSQMAPRRRRASYTYEPLRSSRHIRLLSILTYDRDMCQVYATLDQVSLEDVKDGFTALSYTWGSAVEGYSVSRGTSSIKSPHSVDLLIVPPEAFRTFKWRDDIALTEHLLDVYTSDIRTIKIEGNLSDWLMGYCSKWEANQKQCRNHREGSVFWIDAVCIDQTDQAEKATQIPLMGEVYYSASRVLVWLGQDEMDLAVFKWWHMVVFPRINESGEQDPSSTLSLLREANFTDLDFWKDTFGLDPMLGSWAECWAAYWAFYQSRRWFNRVWIVQETALSRHLVLQCANTYLDCEYMYGFADLLRMAGWLEVLEGLAGNLLPPEYTKLMTKGFKIADIWGIRMQFHTTDRPSDEWLEQWWSVVMAIRRRSCFMPQDKVYGTLGILQQLLDSEDIPVRVDPCASVAQVYTNVARVFMENHPRLTLLSFVEPKPYRVNPTLPSWVPDLGTGRFGYPLGAFHTPFNAFVLSEDSSSFQRKPLTVSADGHLQVRGIRVDTIAERYSRQAPLNPVLALTALEALADLAQRFPEGVEGEDVVSVLVQTFTCKEISNNHRGSPEETIQLLQSFYEWLLVALGDVWVAAHDGADTTAEGESLFKDKRNITELLTRIGPHSLIPQVESLEGFARDVAAGQRGEGPMPDYTDKPQPFMNQIKNTVLHRRVVMTKDDRLGLVRGDCGVGDEVWLLEQGEVPYILRPMGGDPGRWTFEGEAYVHGIMNGELLSTVTEGQLKSVVIV